MYRQIDSRIPYKEDRGTSRRKNRIRHKDYDLTNKLRGKVRARVKAKTGATLNLYFELTSCTGNELKSHLQKEFKSGMSLDNYGTGGWHIDHKIPCQTFDLSKPEQQTICFHFKNLQPMWAMENFLKNGKYNRKRRRWLCSKITAHNS